MFDPTIYENLKVVMEGAVYDLDLDGLILVTGRQDLVDLAEMSRSFVIRFRLKEGRCTAEIRLTASLADLAGEKLEWRNASPGCTVEIRFLMEVKDAAASCYAIQRELEAIWDGRPDIRQTVSYTYQEGTRQLTYMNEIRCTFNRKIDEGHWSDFPELLDVMVDSLEILEPHHYAGETG
ncbi:hypothetical protein [Paenibacillus koleovorans]|uniref:hypothetical protein n=1 Tax=Paenibacillus koleovorans TaxID=121608 RepID=UPI000FDABBD4|nr:hypothetical protein [Paenibacillus koleovorans]